MKITAEPRSDQWNSDDFVGGPKTFTIAGVKTGAAEQKYDIELVEGQGRVWRPPLTVLRLLIEAWGDEAKQWTGRKVTLYRDPEVRFGPESVGGIRVAAMSDLPSGDKPFTTKVTSARGRKSEITVDPIIPLPLIDADTAASFESRFANAATVDQLKSIAADLKAFDLGGFRDSLMAAYQKRGNEIEANHE